MSLYSHKQAGNGGVQPWAHVVTLAEAGKGCDGLFNLYDSLGDKTLIGASTVATLLDGPEKVVRYGALTLGDGTTATSLTASQRCKGLVILCDSLTVKANATLHMTGRGARVLTNDDPFFPFIDYKIPFKISLDSSRMTMAQALAVIKAQGFAPWDAGTFQHLIAAMFGFNCSVSLAGSTALMLASGCGYAGNGGTTGEGVGTSSMGGVGGAGSNGGFGGGGGGACNGTSYGASAGKGGKGCPYSGGSGGGGVNPSYRDIASAASEYSGPGGSAGGASQCQMSPYLGAASPTNSGCGGAGNPGGPGNNGVGGNGCGGKLTIICRGAITVQSGGKIEANGMPGGSGGGNYAGGGGSGGGHVSLISPSAPSNSGTIQAAGGVGGNSGYGGAGGAGSVVTKTFSDMGW